jgi:hypothetical protein
MAYQRVSFWASLVRSLIIPLDCPRKGPSTQNHTTLIIPPTTEVGKKKARSETQSAHHTGAPPGQ